MSIVIKGGAGINMMDVNGKMDDLIGNQTNVDKIKHSIFKTTPQSVPIGQVAGVEAMNAHEYESGNKHAQNNGP